MVEGGVCGFGVWVGCLVEEGGVGIVEFQIGCIWICYGSFWRVVLDDCVVIFFVFVEGD